MVGLARRSRCKTEHRPTLPHRQGLPGQGSARAWTSSSRDDNRPDEQRCRVTRPRPLTAARCDRVVAMDSDEGGGGGMQMKAVVITRSGGPEVLEVRERPVPSPARGEVRVRVRATAVNRAGLLQRAGAYPAPPGAPPDIPGLEYAGEVDAIGEGPSHLAVGDRVFGLCGGG